MRKRVFYTYNPATDDFERYYPSVASRLRSFVRLFGLATVIGVAIYLISFYALDSPTEKNLKQENREIKELYRVLDRRIANSLSVMEDIRKRDENFYRVMMQMDPMEERTRYAGADNEAQYRALRRLSDAAIVEEVYRNIDLLDRELAAQSQSFDQLRKAASEQQERLQHTPQIMPLKIGSFTLASGFGYRRDPIYATTSFHQGVDYAAAVGTPVYATADGKVSMADRVDKFGNCIELDHGFNYSTRYAHLSQMLVKQGEQVRRGTLIGRVGSSGKSTAPHLHYEVLFKNEPQNPVNFYFMDMTPAEYEQMLRNADNSAHVMD